MQHTIEIQEIRRLTIQVEADSAEQAKAEAENVFWCSSATDLDNDPSVKINSTDIASLKHVTAQGAVG